MENTIICLDTSILIDFYRKVNKEKSFFFQLTKTYHLFCISVITEYEILIGSNSGQELFWLSFFEKLTILPFNSEINSVAILVYKKLKAQSKLIEVPDIMIAATAISGNIQLATLNHKHFERIDNLRLIEKG